MGWKKSFRIISRLDMGQPGSKEHATEYVHHQTWQATAVDLKRREPILRGVKNVLAVLHRVNTTGE